MLSQTSAFALSLVTTFISTFKGKFDQLRGDILNEQASYIQAFGDEDSILKELWKIHSSVDPDPNPYHPTPDPTQPKLRALLTDKINAQIVALESCQAKLHKVIAHIDGYLSTSPEEKYSSSLNNQKRACSQLLECCDAQLAIFVATQNDLLNLNRIIKLSSDKDTSWNMAVVKDFINSMHGRGLNEDEFRPYAALLLQAHALCSSDSDIVPVDAMEFLKRNIIVPDRADNPSLAL